MGHCPFAGGEDFIPAAIELEFTPTTLIQCHSIEILNDTVVEGTEDFQVTGSTSDPVSFVNSPATVSILDNQDRKLYDRGTST